MEKHIQTLLLAICTAAIVWGGNQIFQLSVTMGQVQVTLVQMTENQKQYATMDYVTERSRARDIQFADHERRLGKVESLMDAMNIKAAPSRQSR